MAKKPAAFMGEIQSSGYRQAHGSLSHTSPRKIGIRFSEFYKPILFSTPMVQAIQKLLKTMTRRLNGLKEINKDPDQWSTYQFAYDSNGRCMRVIFKDRELNLKNIKIPWQVGDILWVRETWERLDCSCCEGDFTSRCFGEPDDKEGCYVYKATHYITGDARWHPAIHMPRKAARLFLRVKGLRCERLQDITVKDIIAEGTSYEQEVFEMPCNIPNAGETYLRGCFLRLWDGINSKRGYSWNLNPWVWAIEFELIEV